MASQARPFVFVVGNSRSGTTMMSRVLGAHSRIFTFNELHFFEQIWIPDTDPDPLSPDRAVTLAARLLAIQRQGYYSRPDPTSCREEAAGMVDRFERDSRQERDPPTAGAHRRALAPPALYEAVLREETQRQGGTIGCDQTPRNLYYLKELLDLWPEARAVVMVRDPRDVLLSQKDRWKRRFLGASNTPRWNALRTWAGYHPLTMSRLWRGGVAAGERMAQDPRVVTVRFEDLVENPRAEVGRVCRTLGIEFEPAMLAVPRVGSSHRHDEPATRGIDASAAQRWRRNGRGALTPTELCLCQRVAGETMRRWGYERSEQEAHPAARAFSHLTWGLKGTLALALNLRRLGHPRQALRRRFG